MSELKQIQRRMAAAVMTPLTRNDGMRPKSPDGKSMRTAAREFIRPNDRLTSFERLEIYNQQYWFRVLDALAVDFPGLAAVVGSRRFDQLSLAYLTECPSRSFTLRNLGMRLPAWLKKNPKYTEPETQLALDMARLECAHVDAFDAADAPIVGPEDLLEVIPETRFGIQPCIQLLQLAYPVDDLLIAINNEKGPQSDISSNAGAHERKRHPAVEQVRRLQAERIYLAVHRRDFIVCYRRLTREAFRTLDSLQHGNSLGEALEYAMRGSRVAEADIAGQIRNWFTEWAEMGWFCKPP
jgi:Putative DNA-binding domain